MQQSSQYFSLAQKVIFKMHLLDIPTDYVSVCIAEWFWIVQTRLFWVKWNLKIFLRNIPDALQLLMGLVLQIELELA